MSEFRLSGWKLIRAKHMSENIGVSLAAERSRTVRGHEVRILSKQAADGQPVPIREEVAVGERRGGFPARKGIAMASRTLPRLQR